MESNVRANQRQRCGEILINSKCEVFFTCSFCLLEQRSIRKFLKHIHQHIILQEKKLQEIKISSQKEANLASANQYESICEEYVDVLKDTQLLVKDEDSKGEKNMELFDCENSLNDLNLFKDDSQASMAFEDEIILNESFHILTTADECEDESIFLDDCSQELSEESEEEHGDIEGSEIGIRIEVLPQQRTTQNKLPPVPNTIKNQCNICLKVLRNEAILRTHVQRHNEVRERPYACKYCESRFASKSNLNVHIKRHLGIKPYQCETCDKWFTSSTELKLHSYTHSRAKQFKCTVCERDFSRRDHLNAHSRRHYEQKRYECGTCGNKFYERRQLRDHQTTHSAERPFTCETCGLTFKREKALVEHKKLHSGVKSYVCKICAKSFAQYPGLYSHMKSHKDVEQ